MSGDGRGDLRPEGAADSGYGKRAWPRSKLHELALDGSEPEGLRVAEVVAALSQALDLGAGASRWHSVRTCLVGMRIAAEVGISEAAQGDLYYSLLLKDAGCSSNASQVFRELESDDIAAKRDVKKTDWTRVSWETLGYALGHVAPQKSIFGRVAAIVRVARKQKQHTQEVTALRCERGATMARLMGLSEQVATGIAGLDEHWNGEGNPNGLRGEEIPMASRIMLLAQTLDVFATSEGAERALEVCEERSGRWFDRNVVRGARALAKRGGLWGQRDAEEPMAAVLDCEPGRRILSEGDISMDAICQAFAQIVDAKSPFTFNHSNGVANAAVAIATRLGFSHSRILFMRHAGLLHDLGKMAVPNTILEKPGKLSESEWQILRSHPAHTENILRSIKGLDALSEVAASHHEKLDGSGYHRGLTAEEMPMESRVLVVSDIFDALAAKRPYREAMALDKVFEILRKDAPRALDAECVEALAQSGVECDQSWVDLHTLRERIEQQDERSRQSLAAAKLLTEDESAALATHRALVF